MEQETDNAGLAASLRETMAELVIARVPHPETADAKRAVRIWQNQRFARTYADLSRNPRYGAAVEFFLRELYGDVDLTARDADVARVLPLMIKLLPAVALQTIRDALAFEALSERLDTELARHLDNRPWTLFPMARRFAPVDSGMSASSRSVASIRLAARWTGRRAGR